MLKKEYLILGTLCLIQATAVSIISPAFFPLEAIFILTIFFFMLCFKQKNATPAKVKKTEKKAQTSIDFDPTFQIAHETLPFLRSGLNEVTAAEIAGIIQKISDVPAVAITDKERVLAFLGVGCDKHHVGDRILTDATKQVLITGKLEIVNSPLKFGCARRDSCECPLTAAVIVPLKNRDEVIGTLKLYQTEDGELPPYVVRFAIGIAQLLSLQIELAEFDHQRQLLTKAKLDALHAQINPHFFFNTLNTIIMYSRTNPERARRLLIRLADFFRHTFKRKNQYQTLREELEYINTYLVLERARFGNKLKIIEDIDYKLLDINIPFLSLQPLIENAIKHGITTKVGEGAVKISVHKKGDEIVISISDDGTGIPAGKLDLVLQPGYGSGNGVGLSNVHERLISIYGEDSGLKISSIIGKGTTVYFSIPASMKKEA